MWRCTKIDKYGLCLRVVEKPPLNRAKVSTVQYKEKLTAWTTSMLLKVLNRGQWFHIAVWEIKLLVNLWWKVDKDYVIVFALVVVTVVVVVDVFVFVFALANVGQLMKSWWSGSLLQLLPLVWTRGLISQRYQLSLNAQRRKSKMHSLGLLNVPAVQMYKVSSILQSLWGVSPTFQILIICVEVQVQWGRITPWWQLKTQTKKKPRKKSIEAATS